MCILSLSWCRHIPAVCIEEIYFSKPIFPKKKNIDLVISKLHSVSGWSIGVCYITKSKLRSVSGWSIEVCCVTVSKLHIVSGWSVEVCCATVSKLQVCCVTALDGDVLSLVAPRHVLHNVPREGHCPVGWGELQTDHAIQSPRGTADWLLSVWEVRSFLCLFMHLFCYSWCC